MHQPRYDRTASGSAVSNPSWDAIVVTSVALVLGPIAVMAVVSHPLVGVGLLTGLALPVLARRVRSVRLSPDGLGGSAESNPMVTDGGRSDDVIAPESGEP